MKKYLFIFLTWLVSFSFVSAQDNGEIPGKALFRIMGNITEFIFWILMVAAAFFVLLAAYNFLFSGGDPEKTAKGKKNLLYCVLAVVLALLAGGAVNIITGLIEVEL